MPDYFEQGGLKYERGPECPRCKGTGKLSCDWGYGARQCDECAGMGCYWRTVADIPTIMGSETVEVCDDCGSNNIVERDGTMWCEDCEDWCNSFWRAAGRKYWDADALTMKMWTEDIDPSRIFELVSGSMAERGLRCEKCSKDPSNYCADCAGVGFYWRTVAKVPSLMGDEWVECCDYCGSLAIEEMEKPRFGKQMWCRDCGQVVNRNWREPGRVFVDRASGSYLRHLPDPPPDDVFEESVERQDPWTCAKPDLDYTGYENLKQSHVGYRCDECDTVVVVNRQPMGDSFCWWHSDQMGWDGTFDDDPTYGGLYAVQDEDMWWAPVNVCQECHGAGWGYEGLGNIHAQICLACDGMGIPP